MLCRLCVPYYCTPNIIIDSLFCERNNPTCQLSVVAKFTLKTKSSKIIIIIERRGALPIPCALFMLTLTHRRASSHHRTIDQCSFHRLGTIVRYSCVIRHTHMCDNCVRCVVWRCLVCMRIAKTERKCFIVILCLIFFLSFFRYSGLLFSFCPIHIQMNSHKFCRRPIIKRLTRFYCIRLNRFVSMKFERFDYSPFVFRCRLSFVEFLLCIASSTSSLLFLSICVHADSQWKFSNLWILII